MVHGGEEYTKAPVAMILDAILREVYGGTVVQVQTEAKPYELPDNLARFFDAKVSAQTTDEAALTDCCPLTAQRACCDPEDKAECCGASSGSHGP